VPTQSPSIAFIGGTGPEGLGLAMRFARAGNEVIIGSRRQERCDEAAEKVLSAVPNGKIRGMVNPEAVAAGDVIFITVPYDGQREMLEQIKDGVAGKTVVDTVVPLRFAKGKISTLSVEEGSAAEEAQAVLTGSTVVGAFHNLSAKELMDLEHEVPCDVVVCGDDAEAKQTVMDLAVGIAGVRAIDGGGLENSRYVEGITALLLNINRIYKTQSSIRLVGV
jgi:NADPH-dependent F420 reductase